jgi:PhnB protein
MSKAKAIPEGLHSLTPALTIDGAAEAIEFFKRAFGASEISRALDPSGKKVWHATLRIGDSAFFVNDPFPEMGALATPSKLWIYGERVDAAFARATEAGAKVLMAPADMFWGDRMCKVADRWGNEWNLAQRVQDLTPEQMKNAQDAFVANMKK